MKGLIIAPAFHDYNDGIVRCFVRNNIQAKLIEYYDGSSVGIFRLIKTFFRQGLAFFSPRKIKLPSEKYDFILVIKGNGFSENFFAEASTKTDKLILWFYDPLDRFPEVQISFRYFHRIFFFQHSDYDRFRADKRFKYMPLYHTFTRKEREVAYNRSIDFLFIGALTNERIRIIEELLRLMDGYKLVVYGGFGPLKIFSYLKLIYTKPRLRGIVRFGLVGNRKLKQLYLNSKNGLNIFQEGQSGLNMRFFEMYGAGMKQIIWANDLDINRIDSDKSAYRIVGSIADLDNLQEWLLSETSIRAMDSEMSLDIRLLSMIGD
jgi:hypothetical protein